jgi:hypothetical protein
MDAFKPDELEADGSGSTVLDYTSNVPSDARKEKSTPPTTTTTTTTNKNPFDDLWVYPYFQYIIKKFFDPCSLLC